MNITISNYEEYAIDYMEDNLSSAERSAFMAFLKENPSIAKEIELIDLDVIDAEVYTYPDKSKLLKKDRRMGWLLLLFLALILGAYFLLNDKKEIEEPKVKTNHFLAQQKIEVEHKHDSKKEIEIKNTPKVEAQPEKVNTKTTKVRIEKKPVKPVTRKPIQSSPIVNVTTPRPQTSVAVAKIKEPIVQTEVVEKEEVVIANTEDKKDTEIPVKVEEIKVNPISPVITESPLPNKKVLVAHVETPKTDVETVAKPKNVEVSNGGRKSKKFRIKIPAKLAGITDKNRNSVVPKLFQNKNKTQAK